MWPLPCLSSVDILCIIMSAPKTNIAMLYTKLWILKYYIMKVYFLYRDDITICFRFTPSSDVIQIYTDAQH